MPNQSVVLVAVAAGGAIGACGRYLLGRIASSYGGTVMTIPTGTLLANALGCFAAGLLMAWLVTRPTTAVWVSALLMTGVLGGFTTFSAFSFETLRFVLSGDTASAVLNVVMNVVLSLLGVALGWQAMMFLQRAG